MLAGCALSDLVNNAALPSNITDPKTIQTEAGALKVYRGALDLFARTVSGVYIRESGVFTDELNTVSGVNPNPNIDQLGRIDARLVLDVETGNSAAQLHEIRGLAQEGRNALLKYAPRTSPALRAHLFAIEGMAVIMLADLYCSGIPLSSIDFENGYTLTRGFSTEEVYQHALILFDSADMYAEDSVRIQDFIRIGRGRALVALGNVVAAKTAVEAVGTDYVYASMSGITKFVANSRVFISTREGFNGLPYGEESDPRTNRPALFDSTAPLIISSGIEARLIEAEAELEAGQDSWLTILNQLRTTCTSSESCPHPAPRGDGGVDGLIPLADPAAGASFSDSLAHERRLMLLFEERAYWLFLSGHRQGDLRRLVRNYQRPQETVYPVGEWRNFENYGADVNLPMPVAEREKNPLYKGCLNRDA